MKSFPMSHTPRPVLVLVLSSLLLLPACSSMSKLNPFSKDEKTAKTDTVKPLEVPPDLAKPESDPHYLPPEQQAGAVQQVVAQSQIQSQLSGRVAPRWQGVTRMRDGELNWLLVNATPEQTWPLASNFLKQQGYSIARSEPAIGIMETAWKSLADEGLANLRAQVRVRVESYREPGRSEVFLSFKTSEAGAEAANGAADNDRAIEMLNRLAQYLGASKIDDSAPATKASAAPAQPVAAEAESETVDEKQKVKDRWEGIEKDCAICPAR